MSNVRDLLRGKKKSGWCSDLLYKNGEIGLKREIIGSIFPEKLSFDGEQHRTTRVNEVVSLICLTSSELERKKSGQTSSKRIYPLGWAMMGSNHRPKDYESSTLTN